jgi:hypothetical protein
MEGQATQGYKDIRAAALARQAAAIPENYLIPEYEPENIPKDSPRYPQLELTVQSGNMRS